MSLIDKVSSLFGGNRAEAEDDTAITVDVDGTTLYKDDIIAQVLEELEKRRGEKNGVEQQWRLNANFLVGNQYCEINPYRGDIEQLDAVYDWMERDAFNQIAPLVETRVANLKKISYAMKVNPATNELDDYSKAEVSTSILQYLQKNSNFDEKKNQMIYWNELCGSCFWLSWWDANKGDLYAVDKCLCVGDDGVEQEQTKAYFSGDLDYGLLTPYEVFPESIFKQGIDSQRSIIIEQVKTVDEIRELYGIKVDGKQVDTFELTPTPSGGAWGRENTVIALGHRSIDDAAKVITYFERPSRTTPEGRMIIIVNDDTLVYYGNLPYKKIPIVQVNCCDVPGQFFGVSTIERMIPIQRALNDCVNRIHEYIKRIAIGNYLVPEGAVDVEEYEDNGLAPGAFLVYKNGYGPPTPVPNGNLPAEIMQERYNLKSDMEYVAGVSQLMVNGATPSGVTSGTAISNLMEIDNTRLSLTGDHIRNSVRQLSILWLEIMKQHATARRVLNYVGSNNIGKAIVWSAEDINSYDVEYITENELLMSEEMQKQRFFDAYNMGLFTDEQGRIPERVKLRALEFMKVGNYGEIMNLNLLQMQAAQRENVFFENGVVPEVQNYDDHQIHIEEHMRYILQMDFHILKMREPEYAARLEEHIQVHKAILAQEEQKQMMAQMTPQMM